MSNVTLDPIERRQAGRTPRAGWAFIEQKRRDEARRLKRELAETRARMADYFFAMSVPRRRMRIDVTWGDILLGKTDNAGNCPMARAVRRAGIKGALVGPSKIWLGCGKWCWLPENALQFLWRFDGAPCWLFRLFRCRPFSFELTVPEVLDQNSAEIRAGVDVIGLGDVDCFVSTARPDQ